MARSGLGPWRHFGKDQPNLIQRLLPRLVLWRVEDVHPSGDDRDRPGFERAVVGCAINSAGKAGHDDLILFSKVMRHSARETASGGGGIAGADDRDPLPIEQVQLTFGDQQRRRILELAEEARIKALAERKISCPEFLDTRNLALGIMERVQGWRGPAAAPGQIRNRLQRCGGATEPRNQLAICDRPDAGTANQP
jgi:hypothetical protein